MQDGLLEGLTIFQFHYGTIKSYYQSSTGKPSTFFQFHYGTIKRAGNEKRRQYLELFQFHYGTIKSLRSVLISYRLFPCFQFHYGTIKSISENTPFAPS